MNRHREWNTKSRKVTVKFKSSIKCSLLGGKDKMKF